MSEAKRYGALGGMVCGWTLAELDDSRGGMNLTRELARDVAKKRRT